MTPRPCIESGCPDYAIPERARCRTHDLARRRDGTLTGARGTSREWARARSRALVRAGFICDRCLEAEATVVHHRDGNAFNNDQRNLRALCEHCHRLCHEVH